MKKLLLLPALAAGFVGVMPVQADNFWPSEPGRCPYGTMIRRGQTDWMDYNCDGRINVEDMKYQSGLIHSFGPGTINN